jgi:hypothetical protein
LNSNLWNVVSGIFALVVGVYIFVDTTIVRNEGVPLLSLLIISLCIMSFSLSYLYPQFRTKDERMRLIREKGMFYSYFMLMLYLLIFLFLLSSNIIAITAIQLIMILTSFVIITVSLSMVIVSKIF